MNATDTALAIAANYPVFPVVERAKTPLTSHGYKDATRDPQQVRRHFAGHPQANIGVPTGAISGFVVIDVDGDEGAARTGIRN